MSEFNEPWILAENHVSAITDHNGNSIAATMMANSTDYERRSVADRIVACVNACRGIPTALLQECDSPRKLLDEVAFWNANADLDTAADQPAATSAG